MLQLSLIEQVYASVDEDYRIVLSNNLKAQGAEPAVHAVFIKKEGQSIHLPNTFLPS
ncbi:hypothetical protein [Marinagarivorans cellulosilyticus]|uniref:Uncharacterized protein n=1 Tax=Marinagarivorans cellulosilyticus TaxID=2721545 RepID=A0AAN1WKM0_9GAMM|nr:hypothetical protein [Marinagarivorans cellulosilyticus]BCD99338.1 hypothetical protein MARGE09_P3539 [Marinagarivorans cellulosilyticus]